MSVTPTSAGCLALGSTLQRTRPRVISTFTGLEEGRAARCTTTAAAASVTGTQSFRYDGLCLTVALFPPESLQTKKHTPLFFTRRLVALEGVSLSFMNAVIFWAKKWPVQESLEFKAVIRVLPDPLQQVRTSRTR